MQDFASWPLCGKPYGTRCIRYIMFSLAQRSHADDPKLSLLIPLVSRYRSI